MSALIGGAIIQVNKRKNRSTKTQIDWHSGFAGGLELVFRDYKDQLNIEREHALSKQPLRIDFLLIKVNPGTIIDNAIGRLFKTHNIIEYKNPYDELNIDVIWKVIGYAALYKGHGHSNNAIPSDELTITIFRHSRPNTLLTQLEKNGYDIACPSPGIYSISGIITIPIYIVVTRELKEDVFRVLRIMTKNANLDDIKAFITEASKYTVPGDKGNANAVLQVSSTANKAMFEILKGEDQAMLCDALKDILADELKEAKENGASEMKAKLTIIINEKDKTISEQNALIAKLQAELDKKK